MSCGCFLGTIAEFRAKVTDTHGNNKHAKMYNLAADMAELQILGEEYFDKYQADKFFECATNRVFKIIPKT